MKRAKLFIAGTMILVAVGGAVAVKAHQRTSPDLLICNTATDECASAPYSDVSGTATTFTGPFYKGIAGDKCETSGCESVIPAHVYFNN